MQIVSQSGDEQLAQIFLAKPRADQPYLIECVDGLDGRSARSDKWIINVSTQLGCPVGCRFCDAGHYYAGNLSAQEMLAQVQYIAQRHPDQVATCRKLKVHFARMGEPSLNDEVLKAIEKLPDEAPCPDLWCCVATIAPAGREAWFARLAQLQNGLFPQRFQLQFSINSTDQAQRRRIMPIELADFAWIAARVKDHFQPGARKLSLNFALAEGQAFEPSVIVKHFEPSAFIVKITPLNPTVHAANHRLKTILRTGNENSLNEKIAQLREAGFEVILSIGDEREDRIGSNCGQSVRRYQAALRMSAAG